MTRLFIVLAGSCLLGSCAAPKAELAEETPPAPTAVKPGKPSEEDIPATNPAPELSNGLRLPPGFMRLPEDKDFQATTTPGSQSGAPVIPAPPPPAE